jgi:hypothetical protein
VVTGIASEFRRTINGKTSANADLGVPAGLGREFGGQLPFSSGHFDGQLIDPVNSHNRPNANYRRIEKRSIHAKSPCAAWIFRAVSGD